MDRRQEIEELRRDWKPPVELRRSVPREIQLKGGGYVVIVLTVVLLLGGIGLGAFLYSTALRESGRIAVLVKDGTDGQAEITRVWRKRDKSQTRMAAYRFEAAGRVYSKSVSVPSRIWNTLSAGSPLAIRYLASDPSISHPRDWNQDSMPVWVPFLVGFGMAGGGFAAVFSLRRQMSLLSEGRAAPGIVTKYSFAQHGQRRVYYDFAPLHGSVISGKSEPLRKQPPIGSAVCILYDPDNPKRSTMYPLSMVKVV